MFRPIEKDHAAFSPLLEKGETLLASCIFRSISILQALTIGAGGGGNALIGITNKRIIVLPLSKYTTKAETDKAFSVTKSDAYIEGSSLMVKDPVTGKIRNYRTSLGWNSKSGPEAEKFKKLMDSN